MKKGSIWGMLTLLAAIAVSTGCSSGDKSGGDSGDKGNATEAPSETVGPPVTIKLLQFSAELSDNDFKNLVADPVKKKYPNITVEIVRPASGFTPETMIASGDVPDMVYTGSRQITRFSDIGFPLDMSALIKKYKMDLAAFNPIAIDLFKQYGPKGEMFALPYGLNYSALFYNKDLFDKFGAPYPTDSMNWKQVIELGKKVARTEGGVTYRPLNTGFFNNFAAPYQTRFIDPQTLKVNVNNDNMRKAMELFKQINELPGNQDAVNNGRDKFFKDRNLAMLPDFGDALVNLDAVKGNPLNWDVVSYPSFEDAPNKGYEAIIFSLMIYSKTSHPDEAFKALQVITSEENQTRLARLGTVSALKDPKLQQNFGADVPAYKGKNMQGIFKSSPSPAFIKSTYEGNASSALNTYAVKAAAGSPDIATALRQAEDEAIQKTAAAAK